MPNLDEVQSPRERALERIMQEVAQADRDRIPTSRQKLSQLVASEFAIPPAEAADLVDEYCDEHAPGVPVYLQDELESPFLKFMAVFNSILGIASIWWGARVWHTGKYYWAWFVLGAVFVGTAGFSWFKTVHREIANS